MILDNLSGDVGILGGGIGGICVALELAKLNYKVVILEKSANLLQRTSGRTPGRLGFGFHYPGDATLSTARKMIEAATIFHETFPNMILDDRNYDDKYLSKGWYFITKNSQTSRKDFIHYCNEIKNVYSEFIEKHPTKKYYGDRHGFFRLLKLSEYNRLVNLDEVDIGIETNERVLNWDKIYNHLISAALKNKNITIILNHSVVDLKKEDLFVVKSENHGEPVYHKFKIIVNATCEYRLIIDKMLGHFPSIPWTNRLKFLAKIALPEKLQRAHSMFFARGPFAMFTNLGNSTGFVTYAPISNNDISDALSVPTRWEKIITRGFKYNEIKQIGDAITYGVSRYIPEMKNAKIITINAGVVHTKGEADIYDEYSDVHVRYDNGYTELEKNYYSFDTGKLIFAPMYAKRLAKDLLEKS